MADRLIFFVESPFSDRDRSRFGTDFLASRFDITIADVTPLVDRRFWSERHSLQVKDPRLVTITSTNDLNQLLAELQPRVVILNLGVHRYRHHIHRWVRRAGAISVEFQLGAMPGDDVPISADARLQMVLRKPKTIAAALRARSARFRYRRDRPHLFFRGGTSAIARSSLETTRTIDVHGLDFDLYRSTTSEYRATGEPFAVYLDQDMGFHSDYAKNGVTSPVDPERFYPSLNRFFDQFTAATGLRIVVAPHPRSDVSALRTRYTNADVVEQPTALLVADSTAVLTHASTAVSFAVIAHKPIVLIGTQEMLRSWFGRFIRSYERALGLTTVDIEAAPPMFDLTIDERRYSHYIRSFLSSRPDDPRRLWEIVADEIEMALGAHT
jgi:hypothetical protein